MLLTLTATQALLAPHHHPHPHHNNSQHQQNQQRQQMGPNAAQNVVDSSSNKGQDNKLIECPIKLNSHVTPQQEDREKPSRSSGGKHPSRSKSGRKFVESSSTLFSTAGTAVTVTSTTLPPLPTYLQHLVKIYCTLHFFKQQMEESVQHCEEQWEQILYSSASIDVTNGEAGIIELCKEIKPELGQKLQKMNQLMNDMIHVENECLNLLEDAEDGLAQVIRKSNWYRSNPQEFKKFMRQYSAQQQDSMRSLYCNTNKILKDLKKKTSTKSRQSSPKRRKSKEDEIQFILKQGGFSLDNRSSRMRHILSILSDLKKDENNKALFNKHALITSNAIARYQKLQHQQQNRRNRNQDSSPSDELEKLVQKIQELQNQHQIVLKKIKALKY